MSDADAPRDAGANGTDASADAETDAPADRGAASDGTDARAGRDGTGASAGRDETDGRAGRLDASDPILEVRDIRKSFGGIQAVDGATFDVERGTITGLIGPNGAGKSTTFDLITGVHGADGGSVRYDGTDLTALSTHEIARRGVVRTFQITREFPEMTVLENLMVAPPDQRGESLVQSVSPGTRDRVVEQEEELRERVWRTLERFEIEHLAEEYASSLSGGQRKLLELARALLVEPEVLLLDEPMAGVNPTLEENLLEHVESMRAEGYTFLIVEHDMDVIMGHCDTVVVMHQGSVLAEGPPAEIKSNERVIDAYLGGEIE